MDDCGNTQDHHTKPGTTKKASLTGYYVLDHMSVFIRQEKRNEGRKEGKRVIVGPHITTDGKATEGLSDAAARCTKPRPRCLLAEVRRSEHLRTTLFLTLGHTSSRYFSSTLGISIFLFSRALSGGPQWALSSGSQPITGSRHSYSPYSELFYFLFNKTEF